MKKNKNNRKKVLKERMYYMIQKNNRITKIYSENNINI